MKAGDTVTRNMLGWDTGYTLDLWCPRCHPANNKCRCGAKAEHMGDGYMGIWHSQDCPMFDGDHPEVVDRPEGSEKTTNNSAFKLHD